MYCKKFDIKKKEYIDIKNKKARANNTHLSNCILETKDKYRKGITKTKYSRHPINHKGSLE